MSLDDISLTDRSDIRIMNPSTDSTNIDIITK